MAIAWQPMKEQLEKKIIFSLSLLSSVFFHLLPSNHRYIISRTGAFNVVP